MPHKIIQKDYTFETIFDATIFNFRKIIKVLEDGKYDLDDRQSGQNRSTKLFGVEKKWSLRRPFHVTVIAIIKVVDEIDLEEIRSNRAKIFWDDKIKKKENL